MGKIIGVYKITNSVNGSFYIGSSLDVKHRMAVHRCKSMWKQLPSNRMYKEMESIGVDKFVFEIIEECSKEILHEREQYYIELLKPTYNNIFAKGHNLERYKVTSLAFEQTEKRKAQHRKYSCSEKRKQTQKKYRQTQTFKESSYKRIHSDEWRELQRTYQRQLCNYNGEILSLGALCMRFRRNKIIHPMQEARKYLIKDA